MTETVDIKKNLLSIPGLENVANGTADSEPDGQQTRSRTSSFSNLGAPRSRTGSFLGPRKKTASKFTLNINFRKKMKDDGILQEVYYKMDGERFIETRTLKFQAESIYAVDVNTKPDLDIQAMSIQDSKLVLTRLSKNPNPDEEDDASDAGAFYKCDWDANLQVTKDGTRKSLPISIQIENCGTVSYDIQCKVYKPSNDHVIWGKPLHAIQLECAVKSGEVQINQDLFR